jgi:hypothetical protein
MRSLLLLSLLTINLGVAEATCRPEKSHFIAAVLEGDGPTQVWINTRSYWSRTGYLVDHYSLSERKKLAPILEYANLCESQESVYEPCTGNGDGEEIRRKLSEHCIPVEPSFQRWAEG